MNAVEGHIVVDVVFGILEGTLKQLQTKKLEDEEGCYMQWKGMHEALNDFIQAIMDGNADVGRLISKLIEMINFGICINEYCVFHDTEDSIQHFIKHPGDLIGRVIWNTQIMLSFFNDIIKGLANNDFVLIGVGLGDLLYVVFDGKIL